MESNKKFRFEKNPKEKEFHDNFIDLFKEDEKKLSAVVNGWSNDRQNIPKEWLTDKEENICLNIIQWLGSPVGQSFLDSCGFIAKDKVIKLKE